MYAGLDRDVSIGKIGPGMLFTSAKCFIENLVPDKFSYCALVEL